MPAININMATNMPIKAGNKKMNPARISAKVPKKIIPLTISLWPSENKWSTKLNLFLDMAALTLFYT